MSFPDDMSNIPYVNALPVRNMHCDECDEIPEEPRTFEFYEPPEQRNLVADKLNDEADLALLIEAIGEMPIPQLAMLVAAFGAGEFYEMGKLLDEQLRPYVGQIIQDEWNGK